MSTLKLLVIVSLFLPFSYVQSAMANTEMYACIEADRVGFQKGKNMSFAKFVTDRYTIKVDRAKGTISSSKFLTGTTCSSLLGKISCHDDFGAFFVFHTKRREFVYSSNAIFERDVLIAHGKCDLF